MMTLLTKITNFFMLLFECFIELHKMTFELVGDFSYDLQNNSLMWAIFDVFLGIIGIVSILVFDAFIICSIYLLIDAVSIKIRTKEIKRKRVIGTVTKKEHIKASTTVRHNVALNIPMLHYSSAKYNVYVEYKGVPATFNNKKLFEKYKEDDSISLILIENLNKKGITIKRKLELPE